MGGLEHTRAFFRALMEGVLRGLKREVEVEESRSSIFSSQYSLKRSRVFFHSSFWVVFHYFSFSFTSRILVSRIDAIKLKPVNLRLYLVFTLSKFLGSNSCCCLLYFSVQLHVFEGVQLGMVWLDFGTSLKFGFLFLETNLELLEIANEPHTSGPVVLVLFLFFF